MAVVLLVAASGAPAQVDVQALVEQSIRNYERDWREAAAHWSCQETDVTRSDGHSETDVSQVIPLEGTPYDKMLSKDGHPLSGSAERREQRKYEHAVREREDESPEQREARIRKYENERAFVKEVPAAYSFRLTGDQTVNGRPAWVVHMTPRSDFESSTPHAAMFRHVEGTLWIDKQDAQWARAEAQVTQTISIGWILARIGPGAHFLLEQTRVDEGIWLPQRITVSGDALVLMVHSKPINEDMTWSDCRKVPLESVTSAKPGPNQPPDSKSFR